MKIDEKARDAAIGAFGQHIWETRMEFTSINPETMEKALEAYEAAKTPATIQPVGLTVDEIAIMIAEFLHLDDDDRGIRAAASRIKKLSGSPKREAVTLDDSDRKGAVAAIALGAMNAGRTYRIEMDEATAFDGWKDALAEARGSLSALLERFELRRRG